MRYNRELNANLRAVCQASTNDDNKRLLPLVAAGDEAARDQMITNNMPLVLTLVERFIQKNPDCDYLQDDLIGEGLVGLVEAVNHCAKTSVECPTALLGKSIYRKLTHAIVNLPPELTSCDLDDEPAPEDVSDLLELLAACCQTDRERQILALRTQRHTLPDISRSVNCAVSTVHNCLKRIQQRFEEKEKLEA